MPITTKEEINKINLLLSAVLNKIPLQESEVKEVQNFLNNIADLTYEEIEKLPEEEVELLVEILPTVRALTQFIYSNTKSTEE